MGNIGIACSPPYPLCRFRIITGRNGDMQSTYEKILLEVRWSRNFTFCRKFLEFFLIYGDILKYSKNVSKFCTVRMWYTEDCGFEGLHKFYWTIYYFCSSEKNIFVLVVANVTIQEESERIFTLVYWCKTLHSFLF